MIDVDDPRGDDVRALLERHLSLMYATSPPEDVHALDLQGLLHPSITFFSLREHDELLGVGALKALDETHGEIKSMHTEAAARRRGVGRAIVLHILETASRRGIERVSLETGTTHHFAAARALYASLGFVPCPPFADYEESAHSAFMTRVLDHPHAVD